MIPRFFGQWLVRRGCIKAEQLLAALDVQLETNEELGAFAVRAKILTKKQGDEINNAQRETDRRFGEIAVDKGLLTAEQVDRLVERQLGQRRYIGEIIAEEGLMLYHEVMSELDLFRADQINIDRKNEFDVEALADETTNIQPYLSACLTMFERIAHQKIQLIKVEEGASPRQDHTIYQMVNSNSYVALSMGTDQMIHVAKMMSGGEFTSVNPMVLQAAKEMLNVIIGNVPGWLSVEGGSFSPEPPELLLGSSTLPKAEHEVTCFLTGPEYPLELLIGL